MACHSKLPVTLVIRVGAIERVEAASLPTDIN